MEKKYIGYIVILIFVIAVVALAATSDYDSEDEPETLDVNVTEVANAYVYDYNTGYGSQLGITTNGNTATASAGSGMSKNSISFTLCDSEDAAKELYETQAAQYANKAAAGSAMGGLVLTAYTEHGDMTDGSGYYGEASQYHFTSIHYCCYFQNMYVDASLVGYNTGSIADAPVSKVIDAIYGAINAPKAVTAATFANNFAVEDESKTFTGENTYTVTVTDDKNSKAAYAVSGGMISECGVTFVICDNEDAAKEMYSTDEASYKNKVSSGSPMAALTYYGLDNKYSFTDGYGYYGESTQYNFSSIHYSGYTGNVYFVAVYFVETGTFPSSDFGDLMGEVATAIAC